MKKKRRKITKTTLLRAENKHFRTETKSSLLRHHALAALYYARKGNYKYARAYGYGRDKSIMREIAKLKKQGY
jgi:hypothetical protein